MSAGSAAKVFAAPSAVPVLVLDTNVVLDWLLFCDPRCAPLAAAITAGRVRWVASPAMRGELQHVLGRGIRGDWPGDAASVLRGWDRWSTTVNEVGMPAPRSMRCTDSDDQKFVDLALHARASALLSADRAVLKLARHASLHGLKILTADDWHRQAVEPAPATAKAT